MPITSPSPRSSGCTSRVSQVAAVSVFPGSAISSITLFTSNLISLPLYRFSFISALSSLLANSLFQWSIFVKCQVGLSLRDREATPLHALLFACDLITNVQWPITSRLDHAAQLLFMQWFVDWRPSSRVCLLWNYSLSVYHVTTIHTCGDHAMCGLPVSDPNSHYLTTTDKFFKDESALGQWDTLFHIKEDL